MSTAAERLVERTCREQGLPVTVSDPAVLRKIAALLNDKGGPKAADATDLSDALTRKVRSHVT